MKNEIRKELINKRKKLLKKEVLKKSNKIKDRLFEMDEYKKANNILFYVSYDNEVCTHNMVKDCLSNKKNVIVPISDKKNRCLILSELKSWNDLEPGSYGILEPRKDKIKNFSIDLVDFILVPGVGFDKQGRRLGHGKGYYDNLLKKSINALFVGLAFEFQIIDNIPTGSHDISVNKIITENRIIDCF